LGQQGVAPHVVLGTGGPVERRLPGNVHLVGALGPNAHQILQDLGVTQSGGLVNDIEAIAVLAGDQGTRNRWFQLGLNGLQAVVDDRLMQILDGILCGERKLYTTWVMMGLIYPHHDMGHGGQEALHTPIVAGLLTEAVALARPQDTRQLANVLLVNPDPNGG